MMAQAQVEAALTGNESSQSLRDMIEAQEKSEETALQAGKLTEAELYQQKAEILLQKLNAQQEVEKKPTTTVNVLKIGYKGDAIRELQDLLNKAGIKQVMIDGEPHVLAVDGDFGEITQAAVKIFQNKMGLQVDGKAGPQTMKSLESLVGSNKTIFNNDLTKHTQGAQPEGTIISGLTDNNTVVAGNSGMESKDMGYPGGTIGLSPPVSQGTGGTAEQVSGSSWN